MLNTWMNGRGTKQRTDQKSIAQPIDYEEHEIRNDSKRLGGNEPSISKWSWRYHASGTRVFTVIDVGNRKDVEVHRGSYGCNREHGQGEGYEPPLDRLPSAIDGVKKRGHTFEGQRDDHPCNKPNEQSEHRRTDE